MFIIHKHDTGARQPWEYMGAAAGTYKAGQALTVTNGQLAPISTALKTTPPYICMADVTVVEGQTLPVIRVTDKAIYATELSAEAADAKAGAKLEVSAGGLQVDAAVAGTFEVVDIEGTAAGSVVYGRFA